MYLLAYVRSAISFGDGEGLAQWAVLCHADADVVVYADGLLVECALLNLPSGPALRAAVVENNQSDAAPFGHELSLCPFVVERFDVAVGINAEAVDGILHLSFPAREGSRHILPAGLQAVDSHSC